MKCIRIETNPLLFKPQTSGISKKKKISLQCGLEEENYEKNDTQQIAYNMIFKM